MKHNTMIFRLTLIIMMFFFLCGQSLGQEAASKDECVAKVKEVVKAIHEIGIAAVCEKVSDFTGPYVWKDSYVFCADNDQAKMVAHPYPPAVGMDFINWEDTDGNKPWVEILKVANSRGKGWKSYMMFPKPGAPKPLLKTIYFELEPESKIIVGAGYFKYE